MPSPINLPAILIANAMGIAILFIAAMGNLWRLKEASPTNKCLLVLFFCCFLSCVADPLCFLADGKPGILNRLVVIGCNSLLYLCGATTAFVWVHLVANYLKVKLGVLHATVLRVLFGAVLLLPVINLFTPVLFSVDKSNVYTREFGYWIYTVFYASFMLHGLALYLRQRHASGGLKFFPAWAFILPAAFGITIQAVFYGISTATPFITVSFVGVILCLQNEFMLRDKLTGLYNRFYLNTVEQRLIRYQNLKYTAIMLDINGFKYINDTYGHAVGDEALIQLASILTNAVEKLGEVIRYAGDEFIIIVNTQNPSDLQTIFSRIDALLEEFNNRDTAPYRLSVAKGYCSIDLKENSMDAYMDIIDGLMYENKQSYYDAHTRYPRTK